MLIAHKQLGMYVESVRKTVNNLSKLVSKRALIAQLLMELSATQNALTMFPAKQKTSALIAAKKV